MDTETKAKMYESHLKGEGYQPTIDGDGDVIFKYEGRTYYIDVNDDDQYFQLVFPRFWKIDDEAELIRVIAAADHTTHMIKVVKVVTVQDHENVSAFVELFVDKPEDFKPIFLRSLRAIQGAVQEFKEKMNETT